MKNITPRKGPLNGRWKAVPGENAAHKRIYAAKGPASDYACVDCGGAAQEWSYDHTDPNEIKGRDLKTRPGCAYSLDPDHYHPRCKRCHRGFDGAHARARRAA